MKLQKVHLSFLSFLSFKLSWYMCYYFLIINDIYNIMISDCCILRSSPCQQDEFLKFCSFIFLLAVLLCILSGSTSFLLSNFFVQNNSKCYRVSQGEYVSFVCAKSWQIIIYCIFWFCHTGLRFILLIITFETPKWFMINEISKDFFFICCIVTSIPLASLPDRV